MKILVIYNIRAGHGRFKRRLLMVERYLTNEHYDYTVHPLAENEAAPLFIESLAKTYDVFLVLGGDGTVHSVMNGVMRLPKKDRPRLLFLPFGTSNDYAKMLGMRRNIAKNLALLSTNNYRFAAVNAVNDKYFLYGAALGKFSNVSYNYGRRQQKLFGHFSYLLNAFRDLFKRYHFTLQVNDETINDVFLVILTKGDRIGGFNIKGFTQAQTLDDEALTLKIFKRRNFLSWFKVIIFYFFGGLSFKKDLKRISATFTLKVTPPARWNLDGEKGPESPLSVKVLQDEFIVYGEPHALRKRFKA